MRKTVGFLMVSAAALIVCYLATRGTAIDQDIPQGVIGNMAFLGSLGLLRRARMLKYHQAF